MEALYQDDLPSLLREIRASHVVTDFFGYWRRDFDLYENSRKRESSSSTRSVLSSYFTPSNASLSRESSVRSSRDHASTISPRFRTRTTSDDSSANTPDILRSKYYPNKHQRDRSVGSFFSRPSRPRAFSIASTDSSSSGSDRSFDGGAHSSVPCIVDEVPITFGHNPQQQAETSSTERPHSSREALPEHREIDIKAEALAMMSSLAAKRRRKTSVTSLQLNRQLFKDYASPPLSPTASELETVLEQDQPEEDPRTCPFLFLHQTCSSPFF